MSFFDSPDEMAEDYKDNDDGNKWYKIEVGAMQFYTPFSDTKPKYMLIGSDDKPPTPKEAVDFLNGGEKKRYLDDSALMGYEYSNNPNYEPAHLPEGSYYYGAASHRSPERLIPMSVRDDSYVPLLGISQEIKSHLTNFMANEELYRKRGIYKLGLMLYGPPGTGKSSLIRQIIKEMMPPGAVVIYIDSIPSTEFVKRVNVTLKNRIKFFVFEEFVVLAKNTQMHYILNFLDGENSPDKSIIIATTNHPEELPANIVERPSRFDALYGVEMPSAESRSLVFKHYAERDPSPEELSATKDMSVASIKEAIIYSQIQKIDFIQSVKRIQAQIALAKKAFSKAKSLGIGSD